MNRKIRNNRFFIKLIGYLLLFIVLLILCLFLMRFFSHREIDDVTPGIQCDSDLLEKSDVLWVIPEFNNESIANNSEWCNYILSLNKTLGLHGVHHYYNEFFYSRDKEYVQSGIDSFEKCFGYKPEIFKAPQINISEENENMIKDLGLRVYDNFNQITHKVYHCSDTGRFSNRFIDWF